VASVNCVADVVLFCRQYLKRCRRKKAAGMSTVDGAAQSLTTSSLGDNSDMHVHVGHSTRCKHAHHHSPDIAHTAELVSKRETCLTPPLLCIPIPQQCNLLQHTTRQTLQYFRPSHLDQLHPQEARLYLHHLGSSNMKSPRWTATRVTSNIRKDLRSLSSRPLRTTGSRKYLKTRALPTFTNYYKTGISSLLSSMTRTPHTPPFLHLKLLCSL
jgi:hypothetical protein